jgi:hypothetical protein
MNNEEITEWYKAADQWEQEFVNKFGERFSLIINPSKKDDKYAPDLYWLTKYISADLKALFTPFFKSFEYWKINPQDAWTLNVSDFCEYSLYSFDLPIFIWKKFKQEQSYGYEVKAEESIYVTTTNKVREYIKKSKYIHTYGKRLTDEKNALASYSLDLTDKIFIKIY